MNKLSKENYDLPQTNCLYKREPDWKGNHTDTYWCKNWTFKVHKRDDGKAYMLDTYFSSWDSHRIEVTDKNINEFEFIFNFSEVKKINTSESDEYNEEDLYCVATDSGGYSCGGLYWVKKNTVKSHQLLIDKKKSEIESLKRSLEWAERALERLVNNNVV